MQEIPYGNMELNGNNITMFDQRNMTQDSGRYIKLETKIDHLFMTTKKYQEITSIPREEIASFVDMNILIKNMCQLLNMNYIKFNDSLSDDLKHRLSIIEEAQNKLLKIIDDLYEKEVKSKL